MSKEHQNDCAIVVGSHDCCTCLSDELMRLRADLAKAQAEVAELRSLIDRDYVPRHEFATALEERESALSERNWARGDQEQAEAERDALKTQLEAVDDALGLRGHGSYDTAAAATKLKAQLADAEKRRCDYMCDACSLALAAYDSKWRAGK